MLFLSNLSVSNSLWNPENGFFLVFYLFYLFYGGNDDDNLGTKDLDLLKLRSKIVWDLNWLFN
jgi:hypothetical protein